MHFSQTATGETAILKWGKGGTDVEKCEYASGEEGVSYEMWSKEGSEGTRPLKIRT